MNTDQPVALALIVGGVIVLAAAAARAIWTDIRRTQDVAIQLYVIVDNPPEMYEQADELDDVAAIDLELWKLELEDGA